MKQSVRESFLIQEIKLTNVLMRNYLVVSGRVIVIVCHHDASANGKMLMANDIAPHIGHGSGAEM